MSQKDDRRARDILSIICAIDVSYGFQQRIEKLRADREEARKMASLSGIIPDVVEDVAEAVLPDFSLHFESLR